MVFVFLAYGGWSDAATLSAEMRDAQRGIARALRLGLGIVVALYLLANWAYLRGLGLDGLAASSAPAAELMRRAFGRPGEWVIVAIVATTAVTVMNALLIAGARTTYAAARDLSRESRVGHWDHARGTPTGAVVAMGAVALALVGFGTLTRGGFSTMVDYLSPVYWLFLCFSGLAIIRLRQRHPQVPRPFRVPLYPLLPLAFSACSGYVLVSSLVYVKLGALVGVGVLAVGALLLWPLMRRAGDTRI
jgi:amino acid transporter